MSRPALISSLLLTPPFASMPPLLLHYSSVSVFPSRNTLTISKTPPAPNLHLLVERILPVHDPYLINRDEHRHGVASAAAVVGQKPCPKAQRPRRARDGANRLHRSRVRKLARGRVGFLKRHPILRRLEGHGDEGVDEPGRHGGAELVGKAHWHPWGGGEECV